MIRSLWVKILAIMLVILGPLLGAHYFLQNQSLGLAFGLTDQLLPRETLERHQSALKKLAHLDPANEDTYRREFQEAADAQILWNDLALAREAVRRDLGRQALHLALAVVAVSALLSLLIARNIAAHFARLLDENRRHLTKVAKVHALEGWQTTARMLVHELKGPLTPIRLVASELETKHATLPPERFAAQLSDGTRLIATQLRSLDAMLESFTRFAKLPEPRFESVNLARFTEETVETLRRAAEGRADFVLVQGAIASLQIQADPALLQALLRNLVNNALEANPNTKISLRVSVRQEPGWSFLEVANTGAPLPTDLAERLFEPYVSTKRETGKSNMGLGLAICKKIALDHGGDLSLVSAGGANSEVIFRIEIPEKGHA